jgi:hypothetical protein
LREHAPIATVTGLRLFVLNGESATAVEVDGIVVGLGDYLVCVHTLSERSDKSATQTSLSPARGNRNRVDPNRGVGVLLRPGNGKNLVSFLPADEQPFAGAAVVACVSERASRSMRQL